MEQGLVTWSGGHDDGLLIISGQSRLLDDVSALSDIERIRRLMEGNQEGKDIRRLLNESQRAEGPDLHRVGERALRPERLFGDHRTLTDQNTGAISV